MSESQGDLAEQQLSDVPPQEGSDNATLSSLIESNTAFDQSKAARSAPASAAASSAPAKQERHPPSRNEKEFSEPRGEAKAASYAEVASEKTTVRRSWADMCEEDDEEEIFVRKMRNVEPSDIFDIPNFDSSRPEVAHFFDSLTKGVRKIGLKPHKTGIDLLFAKSNTGSTWDWLLGVASALQGMGSECVKSQTAFEKGRKTACVTLLRMAANRLHQGNEIDFCLPQMDFRALVKKHAVDVLEATADPNVFEALILGAMGRISRVLTSESLDAGIELLQATGPTQALLCGQTITTRKILTKEVKNVRGVVTQAATFKQVTACKNPIPASRDLGDFVGSKEVDVLKAVSTSWQLQMCPVLPRIGSNWKEHACAVKRGVDCMYRIGHRIRHEVRRRRTIVFAHLKSAGVDLKKVTPELFAVSKAALKIDDHDQIVDILRVFVKGAHVMEFGEALVYLTKKPLAPNSGDEAEEED